MWETMNADVLNNLIVAAQAAKNLLGNVTVAPSIVLQAKYDLTKALQDVEIDAATRKHTEPDFDGQVFDPLHDQKRLESQLGIIFEVMMDGSWRTLGEISHVTRKPEASISAQLRHLRKPRFGSYVVEKRPRGERAGGHFEYRLLAPDGSAVQKKVETF
jgi:hypothetical protein